MPKEIQPLQINDKIDDMVCIGHIKKRIGPKQYPTKFYIMQCVKCGRTKEMLSSTIRNHKGTTHKACGQFLKTKDPIFYRRWEAMRTRTTNKNYHAAHCYVNKNIHSNEFQFFVDFYDKMYTSYRQLADLIGPENTSLERKDNNLPYSSTNCIWIDKHNQPKNTSSIVQFRVTYPNGQTEIHQNIREFAQQHNLNESTIRDCINPNRKTKSHKGYKFERL